MALPGSEIKKAKDCLNVIDHQLNIFPMMDRTYASAEHEEAFEDLQDAVARMKSIINS